MEHDSRRPTEQDNSLEQPHSLTGNPRLTRRTFLRMGLFAIIFAEGVAVGTMIGNWTKGLRGMQDPQPKTIPITPGNENTGEGPVDTGLNQPIQ